jgi:metal transporter CNNM
VAVVSRTAASPGMLQGSAPRGKSPAASLANVVVIGLINLPLLRALALPMSHSSPISSFEDEGGASPDDPSLWLYLTIALVLVLHGGVFAGLTIA